MARVLGLASVEGMIDMSMSMTPAYRKAWLAYGEIAADITDQKVADFKAKYPEEAQSVISDYFKYYSIDLETGKREFDATSYANDLAGMGIEFPKQSVEAVPNNDDVYRINLLDEAGQSVSLFIGKELMLAQTDKQGDIHYVLPVDDDITYSALNSNMESVKLSQADIYPLAKAAMDTEIQAKQASVDAKLSADDVPVKPEPVKAPGRASRPSSVAPVMVEPIAPAMHVAPIGQGGRTRRRGVRIPNPESYLKDIAQPTDKNPAYRLGFVDTGTGKTTYVYLPKKHVTGTDKCAYFNVGPDFSRVRYTPGADGKLVQDGTISAREIAQMFGDTGYLKAHSGQQADVIMPPQDVPAQKASQPADDGKPHKATHYLSVMARECKVDTPDKDSFAYHLNGCTVTVVPSDDVTVLPSAKGTSENVWVRKGHENDKLFPVQYDDGSQPTAVSAVELSQMSRDYRKQVQLRSDALLTGLPDMDTAQTQTQTDITD